MSTFFFEFGLFLVCSISQYSEGAGNDQCPDPDTAKFAEYDTDQYVVGTRARYICDQGYKREAGISNIITCTDDSGIARWVYTRQPICLGLPPTEKSEKSSSGPQISTSTSTPTVIEGLPPTEKWEKSSSGPQISTSTPTVIEGYCGVPVPYKHATVKVLNYPVGQKLKYKCLNESEAQTPIIGIIMCENSTGVAVWSGLNPPCTNDQPLLSQEQYLNPAPLFIMTAVTMVFIL